MAAEPAPIVILGAARSGTRLLRDALAASGELAVVPHDVNFIWRIGNERRPDDALRPEWCSASTAAAIRRALSRAAGAAGRDPTRRLLEKTVSNALRVDFVARVLPGAQFVHLIRDGREVVASARRQWLDPADAGPAWAKLATLPWRNLGYAAWVLRNRVIGSAARDGRIPIWGVRYAGVADDLRRLSLAEVCARQWTSCVASVRDAASRPHGPGVAEIRFEALARSRAPLAELAERLALRDPRAVVAHFERCYRPPPAVPWDSGLAPADSVAASRIMDPLRAELGYR